MIRRHITAAALLVGGFAFAAADRPAEKKIDWARHRENAWVKQSPREGAPAPSFGWEASGAYDPLHRKWVHHGGHDGIPQGFSLFAWDVDAGLWRQHFPDTSPPGVCCVDGSYVFDVANGRFVRFPGACLGHGSQWSRGVRLKDSHAWLYDLERNTWTNMRPPPYKEQEKYSRNVGGGICAGATYDRNNQLVVSFGGTGAGGASNSLFVYDAYANRFEQLKADNPPPERDGMGLACDAAHDCLVMFGSQYLDDERTWIYRFRTNKWEAHDLSPRPAAKKLGTYSTIPRMAYDTISGIILCVAWLGEDRGHETWALDVGKMQWTRLNPATEPDPSKSRSRNLDFSPDDNVFILEALSVKGERQIWTYRYKQADDELLLDPPTDVALTTDPGKATLTWTRSFPEGVVAYNVYRAEPSEPWRVDFVKVGTTQGSSFEDMDLTAGRVYFYTIKTMADDGSEGLASARVRTQPRVLVQPVVSVLAANKVEVTWNKHSAGDVVGYNVYRGCVTVGTIRRGTPAAWKDNDPEYPEPVVVKVRDITDIEKLNDKVLEACGFVDSTVDLAKPGPESGNYKYAVCAYIVRAVNRLGTESGPSPYALTIPSEPQNVLLRETGGNAELKWDPSREKGITGYRIYKLGKGSFDIVRVTETPIKATTFTQPVGGEPTRYWVVAVDALGQEGQPSSPVWCNQSYKGFYEGEWHQ